MKTVTEATTAFSSSPLSSSLVSTLLSSPLPIQLHSIDLCSPNCVTNDSSPPNSTIVIESPLSSTTNHASAPKSSSISSLPLFTFSPVVLRNGKTSDSDFRMNSDEIINSSGKFGGNSIKFNDDNDNGDVIDIDSSKEKGEHRDNDKMSGISSKTFNGCTGSGGNFAHVGLANAAVDNGGVSVGEVKMEEKRKDGNGVGDSPGNTAGCGNGGRSNGIDTKSASNSFDSCGNSGGSVNSDNCGAVSKLPAGVQSNVNASLPGSSTSSSQASSFASSPSLTANNLKNDGSSPPSGNGMMFHEDFKTNASGSGGSVCDHNHGDIGNGNSDSDAYFSDFLSSSAHHPPARWSFTLRKSFSEKFEKDYKAIEREMPPTMKFEQLAGDVRRLLESSHKDTTVRSLREAIETKRNINLNNCKLPFKSFVGYVLDDCMKKGLLTNEYFQDNSGQKDGKTDKANEASSSPNTSSTSTATPKQSSLSRTVSVSTLSSCPSSDVSSSLNADGGSAASPTSSPSFKLSASAASGSCDTSHLANSPCPVSSSTNPNPSSRSATSPALPFKRQTSSSSPHQTSPSLSSSSLPSADSRNASSSKQLKKDAEQFGSGAIPEANATAGATSSSKNDYGRRGSGAGGGSNASPVAISSSDSSPSKGKAESVEPLPHFIKLAAVARLSNACSILSIVSDYILGVNVVPLPLYADKKKISRKNGILRQQSEQAYRVGKAIWKSKAEMRPLVFPPQIPARFLTLLENYYIYARSTDRDMRHLVDEEDADENDAINDSDNKVAPSHSSTCNTSSPSTSPSSTTPTTSASSAAPSVAITSPSSTPPTTTRLTRTSYLNSMNNINANNSTGSNSTTNTSNNVSLKSGRPGSGASYDEDCEREEWNERKERKRRRAMRLASDALDERKIDTGSGASGSVSTGSCAESTTVNSPHTNSNVAVSSSIGVTSLRRRFVVDRFDQQSSSSIRSDKSRYSSQLGSSRRSESARDLSSSEGEGDEEEDEEGEEEREDDDEEEDDEDEEADEKDGDDASRSRQRRFLSRSPRGNGEASTPGDLPKSLHGRARARALLRRPGRPPKLRNKDSPNTSVEEPANSRAEQHSARPSRIVKPSDTSESASGYQSHEVGSSTMSSENSSSSGGASSSSGSGVNGSTCNSGIGNSPCSVSGGSGTGSINSASGHSASGMGSGRSARDRENSGGLNMSGGGGSSNIKSEKADKEDAPPTVGMQSPVPSGFSTKRPLYMTYGKDGYHKQIWVNETHRGIRRQVYKMVHRKTWNTQFTRPSDRRVITRSFNTTLMGEREARVAAYNLTAWDTGDAELMRLSERLPKRRLYCVDDFDSSDGGSCNEPAASEPKRKKTEGKVIEKEDQSSMASAEKNTERNADKNADNLAVSPAMFDDEESSPVDRNLSQLHPHVLQRLLYSHILPDPSEICCDDPPPTERSVTGDAAGLFEDNGCISTHFLGGFVEDDEPLPLGLSKVETQLDQSESVDDPKNLAEQMFHKLTPSSISKIPAPPLISSAPAQLFSYFCANAENRASLGLSGFTRLMRLVFPDDLYLAGARGNHSVLNYSELVDKQVNLEDYMVATKILRRLAEAENEKVYQKLREKYVCKSEDTELEPATAESAEAQPMKTEPLSVALASAGDTSARTDSKKEVTRERQTRLATMRSTRHSTSVAAGCQDNSSPTTLMHGGSKQCSPQSQCASETKADARCSSSEIRDSKRPAQPTTTEVFRVLGWLLNHY